jgi:hypothetical protein
MHEPVVELLPSLVVLGTVGAHWLVRVRAAVTSVAKAEPAHDEDGLQADPPDGSKKNSDS